MIDRRFLLKCAGIAPLLAAAPLDARAADEAAGKRIMSSAEVERTIPIVRFGNAGYQALISGVHIKATVVETAPVHWFGKGLQVDFGPAAWPELSIQMSGGVADWSLTRQLAIPVRNLSINPVSLAIRVNGISSDGAPQPRSGIVRLQPQEAVVLVLPLRDSNPATMGMRMGPPPDAPRLGRPVRVIGGAQGALDLQRVTMVQLALPFLGSSHTLIFGEPGTLRGQDQGRRSYLHIADQFGQYTRATWPKKISSIADMQEEGHREERLLQQWLSKLPPRDRFGGILQGPSFKATGFFRTERRNGRWRLVTPEGHEFFSLGVDVISPDVGMTSVTGRKFMFTGLPRKGEYFARHFGTWHGATTFNFYAANLERKFGRDYLAAWRCTTIARLRAWGFNTIGNWSEPRLIAINAMPYVVPVSIWGNDIPDVFDPKFATTVDMAIAQVASNHKTAPFLIGYFVDNEPAWGIAHRNDPRLRYALAVSTLQLKVESPAKRAFVQLLADKYRSAEAYASAWSVACPSWDMLRRDKLILSDSTLARPAVTADLSEFTTRYANAYYRSVAAALHRHDPNHLYLGSRFQARIPEVVEACARYCDVVSFNVYDREISSEEWACFHDLGKPVIIGEFQFGSADRGLFWPGLYNVASEDQRGPAYAHYLRSALANPDIVGCHWFQYVDEPLTGRPLDGENGHIGFVSVSDIPYHGFVAAVREANLSLLGAFP
jgi:hypothetical protein